MYIFFLLDKEIESKKHNITFFIVGRTVFKRVERNAQCLFKNDNKKKFRTFQCLMCSSKKVPISKVTFLPCQWVKINLQMDSMVAKKKKIYHQTISYKNT